MGRILAVDPGERRIGLALSDPSRKVALPLETIMADEELVNRIAGIAEQNVVGEVVVGLPLKLDGTEGPAAARARSLAADLERSLRLPVRLVDERLTTAAAGRALRETGVDARKGRKVIDKMAATLLLQSYLDGQKHQ